MKSALLPLLLTLAGCDLIGNPFEGDATTPAPTTGARPAGSPDVVILAASGHEFTVTSGPYREGYLIRDGAALDVGASLEALGLTVSIWDHGDAFWNHDVDGNAWSPLDSAEVVSFGFLQLVVDLEFIRDNWIAAYDNPTRIVVLAHSHGVLWAHLAMHLVTDAPVDALIDLDGDVEGWDQFGPGGVLVDNWDLVIQQYVAATGVDWPFDASAARDSWSVPGEEDLMDIEDVVPASATVNLEVWGLGQPLRDEDPNLRLDGSELDVVRLETTLSHEMLARSGTEATAWIGEQLTSFYGQ